MPSSSLWSSKHLLAFCRTARKLPRNWSSVFPWPERPNISPMKGEQEHIRQTQGHAARIIHYPEAKKWVIFPTLPLQTSSAEAKHHGEQHNGNPSVLSSANDVNEEQDVRNKCQWFIMPFQYLYLLWESYISKGVDHFKHLDITPMTYTTSY